MTYVGVLRRGPCSVRVYVSAIVAVISVPALIVAGWLASSWAASERAQLAQDAEHKTREILAEAGYEQVYDIDEIITRMPTPDEVERLSISTGTPVAEHIRTGYTADNQPVRVMVSIIPGDTLILQYTIPT